MLAREVAAWKRKVSAAWDGVRVVDVQRVKIDNEAIFVGLTYHFEVTVNVAGLAASDIGAELVIARQIEKGQAVNVVKTIRMQEVAAEGNLVTYALDYRPDDSGTYDVALRIFPSNPRLPHRMDFALVKWA